MAPARPCAAPLTGVIVTGGAGGLGHASALALAEVGRPLALWDIDGARAQDAAADLARLCGVPAIGLGVDLRDAAATEAALAETRRRLPSIGGIVHSAGTSERCGFETFDAALFDDAMMIHVRALAHIVRLARDDLARHPGSAVVAMASMQARMGEGRVPSYSAAKGAVVALVLSLADALAPHGIRINAVSPGMMVTPMFEKAFPPGPRREAAAARAMLGRIGEPMEVGRAVRFLMSDDASYITGTDLLVDGGYAHSAVRPQVAG